MEYSKRHGFLVISLLIALFFYETIEWISLGAMSSCNNGPDGSAETVKGYQYAVFISFSALLLLRLRQRAPIAGAFFVKSAVIVPLALLLVRVPILPQLPLIIFRQTIQSQSVNHEYLNFLSLALLLALVWGLLSAERRLKVNQKLAATNFRQALRALITATRHILVYSTYLIALHLAADIYSQFNRKWLCSEAHLIEEPSCFCFTCGTCSGG